MRKFLCASFNAQVSIRKFQGLERMPIARGVSTFAGIAKTLAAHHPSAWNCVAGWIGRRFNPLERDRARDRFPLLTSAQG